MQWYQRAHRSEQVQMKALVRVLPFRISAHSQAPLTHRESQRNQRMSTTRRCPPPSRKPPQPLLQRTAAHWRVWVSLCKRRGAGGEGGSSFGARGSRPRGPAVYHLVGKGRRLCTACLRRQQAVSFPFPSLTNITFTSPCCCLAIPPHNNDAN